MSRVLISDSPMTSVINLSEGNPGAITFMLEMLEKDDWYGNVTGIMMLLSLDTLELYGDKAYMLWNDCCDRDLSRVELVLRNWQMGELSKESIHQNLSGGRGRPFDNLKSLSELFPSKVADS